MKNNNTRKFFCDICRISIDYNKNTIKEHQLSERHMKIVRENNKYNKIKKAFNNNYQSDNNIDKNSSYPATLQDRLKSIYNKCSQSNEIEIIIDDKNKKFNNSEFLKSNNLGISNNFTNHKRKNENYLNSLKKPNEGTSNIFKSIKEKIDSQNLLKLNENNKNEIFNNKNSSDNYEGLSDTNNFDNKSETQSEKDFKILKEKARSLDKINHMKFIDEMKKKIN